MAESLISAVVETTEPEHARQARAAAVATALQENLRLVGAPKVQAKMLGRRRYYVYTWETAPLDTTPPMRFDRDGKRTRG